MPPSPAEHTDSLSDQGSRSLTGTSVKARAWRAFFETSAKITTEIEDQLYESTSLRLADYNVLLLLMEAPGEQLRMGELADKLVFSPSRLSYRVKILEDRGIIRREADDLDRRGMVACLTDTGRELFARASREHAGHIKAVFHAAITKEQAEALEAICQALLARGAHSA